MFAWSVNWQIFIADISKTKLFIAKNKYLLSCKMCIIAGNDVVLRVKKKAEEEYEAETPCCMCCRRGKYKVEKSRGSHFNVRRCFWVWNDFNMSNAGLWSVRNLKLLELCTKYHTYDASHMPPTNQSGPVWVFGFNLINMFWPFTGTMSRSALLLIVPSPWLSMLSSKLLTAFWINLATKNATKLDACVSYGRDFGWKS